MRSDDIKAIEAFALYMIEHEGGRKWFSDALLSRNMRNIDGIRYSPDMEEYFSQEEIEELRGIISRIVYGNGQKNENH